MLSDRVLSATCHWLNGDSEGVAGEELDITAACVDGDALVITYQPTNDGVPFRARFALMEMELATSAALRQSASAGT